MTRLCLSLLSLLVVASAFTSPMNMRPAVAVVASKPLFMFNADDKPSSPLSEVKEGETADVLESSSTSADDADFVAPAMPAKPMMMVKNRNTGELLEVEVNESFLANENFEMNWWAWIGFVAFPGILLANDAFHFLPTDGPLGFLGKF